MTTEQIIGLISGFLVSVGIFPYAYRVWHRQITTNFVTWFVWLVAAYALVVNYKASGAKDNVWPAIFSCFNVTLVFTIALIRGKRERLMWWDYTCLFLGLASLAGWWLVGNDKQIAAYALYLGIAADVFATIPTFLFLMKEPWEDRPFAWITFSIGYAVTMLAITEHTFNNYVLPVYMSVMALTICFPLIRYRIQNKVPLKDWI